jgi:hypothetical protein
VLLAAIIDGGPEFEGFHGLSLALLTLAVLSLGGWLGLAVVRWFATRPSLPAAAPPTKELRDEPPAVVNFLVNRCHATRVAVAATFLDLAARRFFAVDMLDLDRGVVRLRHDADASGLRDYERQVYSIVTSRATGGSAPLEVLEITDSEKWFKRFSKGVISDARHAHLAANRWSRFDYVGLGGTLAVICLLFALAFATAGLWVEDTGSDDDFTRFDWLWVAGIAWFVLMLGLGALRAVRETAAGRAACSHWLGYRAYCRQSRAFEELPPAAVTVWGRYLAHAVAVGSAHDTAEDLPFATEEPQTAWTRSTGVWRQVRVEYPSRFGFGQAPWKAALEGFARMAFFGALAFFILPILLPIVLDLRSDLGQDIPAGQERTLWLFVAGAIVVQSGLGIYWAINALAGAIRFVRGAADLGRRIVVEGEVIKIHGNRVAVDDGRDDETAAWFRPPGCPALSRGQRVRVTRSPWLHHVTSVEVLASPA